MNKKKLGFGCILSARKFADTAVALSAWSELCEECFKEKSNPPSKTYFLRHFYQDSVDETIIALNSSGIYVCIDKDEDRLVKQYKAKTLTSRCVNYHHAAVRKCSRLS
jgi:hypothetical protein